MNTSKVLPREFVLFVCTFCLVIPSTILAEPPEVAPPILQELSSQLQELSDQVQEVSDKLDDQKVLVRRLHGNKAAIFSQEFTRTIDGQVLALQPQLAFCIGGGDLADRGAGISCIDQSDADYLLISPDTFQSGDDKKYVTFDAQTSASFADIANLLADGLNDRLGGSVIVIKSNDTEIPGGYYSSERARFFTNTQVSSQVGYVDLEGFEIGRITIFIDNISLMYFGGTNETDVSMRYRIFYELAD